MNYIAYGFHLCYKSWFSKKLWKTPCFIDHAWSQNYTVYEGDFLVQKFMPRLVGVLEHWVSGDLWLPVAQKPFSGNVWVTRLPGAWEVGLSEKVVACNVQP